jgi:DNA-binding beta-propeller fold protein YncE
VGVVLSLAGGLAIACAADDAGSLGGGYGGGSSSGGAAATGGFNGDGGEPLPPEEELEEDFEVPAAVGRFLWAANPKSNRVALVDAVTLEVQAFDAGFAPTYLAGVPRVGDSPGGAVVLNELSQDATVFLLPADDEAPVTPETLTVHTLAVHRHANAWRIGPNSRFAIAWSNARAFERNVDPTQGLQDITVLDLGVSPPTATRLSVGYRPSQVFVDAAGERAYVVSQPGITVVHLTHDDGPRIERELFLPEHPSGGARDVSITPDGSLAFVRLEGQSEVLVLQLATDTRVTVSLPAPVTDLDVSADGLRAVAVMRRPDAPSEGAAGAGPEEPSRVAILPVATITTAPADYELVSLDGLFGSAVVSANGSHALLFTNGVPHDVVSIVDLATGSHRELDLFAPVRAVFLTEDGSHAVALLSLPAGSAAKGAFSLVPVTEEFPPKLEGTDAPARFVSLSANPARALITTDGGPTGPHGVLLARFPELRVDRIVLPSAPLASGIVPDAGKGFVAQVHPEGRVTFVGLADGAARTLTGFELGGKVVE